jgi:hypothetical protein
MRILRNIENMLMGFGGVVGETAASIKIEDKGMVLAMIPEFCIYILLEILKISALLHGVSLILLTA